MADPITIAALSAGANLLGQGVNAYAQGRMNKKTMKFSREMYDVQRRDHLADWERQNQYNSPQSQMQRLKDAGLNPNLVYGATAPGNSSGSIHSATPPSWSPKAPQFDLGDPLSAYFNIATQSAQLDNVKALNEKIKADTQVSLASAGIKDAELSYADGFYKYRSSNVEAQANINSWKSSDMEANWDARQKAQYTQYANIIEQAGLDTKIKNAILSGKSVDNTLKSLDVDLRKNGINPSDPIVLRLLGRLISNFVDISTLNFK